MFSQSNAMPKEKVLIVEDEKIIAKDLELRLRGMDYEVVAAVTNGLDAIEAAKYLKPNLVLMDVMIDGDIDGIETADLIHGFSDVPIIFLTAYADEKTFQRAKVTDPFGYILKPFQERELDIAIQTSLQKYRLESRVKESEIRFRNLFEQNYDAILVASDDARIMESNKAAERMYCTDQATLKSMHLYDLIPGVTRSKFADEWKAFLKSGDESGRYKVRIADKIRYIEYQAKSNFVKGNHLIILRDVTQAVEDQRMIEQLARFPAESPHPIFRISLSGKILFANKAANAILDKWRINNVSTLPESLRSKIEEMAPEKPFFQVTVNIERKFYLFLFVYIAEGHYVNIYGTEITQQKYSERLINFQKDILELIAKGLPISEILSKICAKVQPFLPEGYPCVFSMNQIFQELELSAGYHLPLKLTTERIMIPLTSRNLPGRIAIHKDFAQTNNPLELISKKLAPELEFHSGWGLPVLGKDDELIAVIAIYYNESYEPDPEEISFLTIVTRLISVAIERDQIFGRLNMHSLAFENISDAIVLTDSGGKIMEWSPSAERIFKVSKTDVLGKSINKLKLFDNQFVDQLFTRIKSSQQISDIPDEIAFSDLEGIPGLAQLNVAKMHDLEGSEVGFLSVFRDITIKRQIESALKVSESYLKAIFDNTVQSFILLDLQGNILAFNKAANSLTELFFAKRLGYGNSIFNYWEFPSIDNLGKVLNDCLKGRMVNAETSYKADGKEHWIELNFLPVYEQVDHVSYICFTGLDISERKQFEINLQASESRFRSLVQNSSDITLIIDEKSHVQYASESLYRILGYQLGQIKMLNIIDFVVEEDKAEYVQAIDAVKTTNQQMTFVCRFTSGKGEILYLESILSNLIKNPYVNGIVVNARDVTERTLAEEELKRTNFELDSFVYRASHDLRAPLRSVLGLLNLIGAEAQEEERRRFIGLAEKSIKKLDSFILDLTNFSRNSRLEVLVEPVNFQHILDECLDNLKFMENASKLSLSFSNKLNKDFYSDPGRISIVFQNLVSNSIKYQSLVNPPHLDLNIFPDRTGIQIVFSDNGKGIGAEHLPKLFQMFFRASEESYGSGLGLYITKQVIEKLGGKIKVNSGLGVGTTFSIWLPDLKPEYGQ